MRSGGIIRKATWQQVNEHQVKDTLEKRNLHEWKNKGFATRCKPLVTLKNKKAGLDFARKRLKESAQLGKTKQKTLFEQMKTLGACARIMGTFNSWWSEAYRISCQTCWRQYYGIIIIMALI